MRQWKYIYPAGIPLIVQQSLQNDIHEDNLKTLKTDKYVKRRKLQKLYRKNNNRNEAQIKTSSRYINSNWSFKLVEVISSYRICIRFF